MGRVAAAHLSNGRDMIATLNPATGELPEIFDALSGAEVHARIGRAWDAYTAFRHTSFEDRAAAMRAVAGLLENQKRRWAALMTTEVGKPVAAAEAEAVNSAWVCRYYADHAERMLADEAVPLGEGRAHVRHEPLGPVLAVMPWNFPFWQLFRFAAPAIVAGNVVLLKHAPNVPRCALAIEEIFGLAGFPDGVFQTLLIDVQQVAAVLDDDRVRAATLTGSVRAGAAVGSHAVRRIKRSVLELGGSDAILDRDGDPLLPPEGQPVPGSGAHMPPQAEPRTAANCAPLRYPEFLRDLRGNRSSGNRLDECDRNRDGC